MELAIQILKLCAGIGLFLFAMYLLEESLKHLSGRRFKIFLQRITKNRMGAIAGGTIVTAVLQSSSMVSVMVLAFVEAGVFTMKNALAIILGANLGTTLSNWMVATLGFKVNIEVAAYPAVCVGGFLLVILGHRKTIKYTSYFLLGFGLVFIGLSFMKTAMEAQVSEFDFSKYAETPVVVFLLIGFILTTLVQSSSVTVALTLSALHVGAIGFLPATAIVLGSETGTSIKIVVGAIGGTASKKRVALGNLFFNIALTVFAYILLKPIVLLITDVFKISDPLIGLVMFASLINVMAIAVFTPLLNPFAKLLEKFFKSSDASASTYIAHADIDEAETALDLLRKETELFIHNSMLFNLGSLDIDLRAFSEHAAFKAVNEKKKFFQKTPEEKYELLKHLQGEIQAFYLALTTRQQSEELNRLISAVRSTMHSVKSMKDIGTNIGNLRDSSKDIKFNFFMHHKKETEQLYRQLNALMKLEEKADFEKLQKIYDTILENYSTALSGFYKEAQHAVIEDIDITTAINFNRELFTSNKAMLIAVKDFLLNEKQAQDFNEIPVYRT